MEATLEQLNTITEESTLIIESMMAKSALAKQKKRDAQEDCLKTAFRQAKKPHEIRELINQYKYHATGDSRFSTYR